MKQNHDETNKGLNQIFEIINAKGDQGEINEILEKGEKKGERDKNSAKS